MNLRITRIHGSALGGGGTFDPISFAQYYVVASSVPTSQFSRQPTDLPHLLPPPPHRDGQTNEKGFDSLLSDSSNDASDDNPWYYAAGVEVENEPELQYCIVCAMKWTRNLCAQSQFSSCARHTDHIHGLCLDTTREHSSPIG